MIIQSVPKVTQYSKTLGFLRGTSTKWVKKFHYCPSRQEFRKMRLNAQTGTAIVIHS